MSLVLVLGGRPRMRSVVGPLPVNCNLFLVQLDVLLTNLRHLYHLRRRLRYLLCLQLLHLLLQRLCKRRLLLLLLLYEQCLKL